MTTARPFLMFQGGSAQAALDLYFATFPDSRMVRVERWTEGEPGRAGTIKVAVFTLCGREFMCSDSPIKHDFSFTPASSTFVEFDTAAQLERVFGILSEGGQVLMPLDDYGFSRRFGWLNDRFGVSWQLNLADQGSPAADTITPQALRFERLLDAPVEKVWRYLVDPGLRARWFMAGPTELKVGGSFGLTMNHDDLSDEDVPTPERYRPYLGKSWEERITRYEPPHVLAITWDGGAAGEVTFTLSAEGGKTRLVLTHEGLRGRDDAVNFGGGWHAHLAALEKRIKGAAVPDFWALDGQAQKAVEKALGRQRS